jgi:hypothetical protein
MARVPSSTIARVSLYSAVEWLVGEVHDQARANLLIRGCAGWAEPVGAAGPDGSPREDEGDKDESEDEGEGGDEGWWLVLPVHATRVRRAPATLSRVRARTGPPHLPSPDHSPRAGRFPVRRRSGSLIDRAVEIGNPR